MFRLNRGYRSLYSYLKHRNPLGRWVNQLFSREAIVIGEDEDKYYRRKIDAIYRWNPQPHWSQQFIGAFQPLANMLKDAVDTLRPYKSGTNIYNDLAQPIRGLGNILKGVTYIVVTPFVFVWDLCASLPYILRPRSFFPMLLNNFVRSFSWLIDGCASIVRGATQVLATSLTLLVKMPLRGIITSIFGAPKIEENPGIQVVAKASISNDPVLTRKDNLDINGFRDADIARELHRKFRKAVQNGQPSYTDPNEENAQYIKNSHNGHDTSYTRLFSKYLPGNKSAVNPGEDTYILETNRETSRATAMGRFAITD